MSNKLKHSTGDRVRVCDDKKLGRIKKVVTPYFVEFDDGTAQWVWPEDVEKA